MNQAVVALIGAAVGGLASLTGVVVSGLMSSRREMRRDRFGQDDRYLEKVRSQLTEVLRLLFIVETEVYTICWLAANVPEQLDHARTELYRSRMHETLPQLSAAAVVLGSMDSDAYDSVMPWVERIDEMEGVAARTLYRKADVSRSWSELGAMVPQLIDFYHSLPKELGSVLRDITAVRVGKRRSG